MILTKIQFYIKMKKVNKILKDNLNDNIKFIC